MPLPDVIARAAQLGDVRPRAKTPQTRRRERGEVPSPSARDGTGMVVALAEIPGYTPAGLFDRLPASTGGYFYFQCPPLDNMPVERAWTWNDFPTVGSGMHSTPAYSQLTSITFNSLMVDEAEGFRMGRQVIPGPRFARADLPQNVLWACDFLARLGDSMRPFQLQWGQKELWGRWDGFMAATLRSFHLEERAGEIDARYFTVSFTEYPDAPLVERAPSPAPPGGRAGHSGASQTARGRMLHTLDSSKLPAGKDTLAYLAKHFYGSASKWRLISKASGLQGSGIGPSTSLRATLGKRHPPGRVQIPAAPRAAAAKKRRGH